MSDTPSAVSEVEGAIQKHTATKLDAVARRHAEKLDQAQQEVKDFVQRLDKCLATGMKLASENAALREQLKESDAKINYKEQVAELDEQLRLEIEAHGETKEQLKAARQEALEDNYVAWIRYRKRGEQTIVQLCDSDDEGAFKVYRLKPGG